MILLILLAPLANAGDWPAWRGPSADGVVVDSNVPLTWSPDSAAWKTKIPGTGYSSPIIRGDRIVLTSSGVKSPTDRCVICINFASGNIEWTTPVFDSPIEKMHRLNSPASSTPTCDDDHIYVTFTENGYVGVAALDFEGKLIWTQRPG
ncbi:MAG: PQQ-binding-like beta-propeller repeat protein, partial [Planctomycetaceae bacterium]